MRIALATCDERPEGTADDQLLANALLTQGRDASFQIWSAPNVHWSSFDAVVIRSTWDYHRRLPEFLAWADQVASQTRLLNPAETIRWNSSKTYLRELAAAGIPVVPTSVFESHDDALGAAQTLLRVTGAVVVKPTVSATAELTFKITEMDTLNSAIESVLKRGPLVLQPLLRSVETDGELSLMFFRVNGRTEYSHAIVKRAKSGDFRVQQDFGGTTELIEATASLIDLGRKIIDGGPPVSYVRVDLLDWRTKPRVGEIELIEPELFFRHSPRSIELMINALG